MKCTSIFLVAGAAALFPVAGASEEVSKQIQRQFFSKTGKTRGVRGVQTMQKKFTRRLHPHPHGGSHHSSYSGCLAYTSEELEDSWIFESDAPDCSYVHHSDSDGSGDDDTYGNDEGDTVVSNEDNDDDGNQYDPMGDFLVEECDTYENLWAWDLSLSCEDPNTLSSCNCTFAEELFAAGLLSCDDAERCPENCHICGTCLSVLGCQMGNTGGSSMKISTSTLLWIIGAVVLALLLGLAWYHTHRRRQEENELSKNLMAGEYTVGKSLDYAQKGDKQASLFEPPEPLEGAGLAAGGAAVSKTSHSGSDSDLESDFDDGTLPTIDESTIASTKAASEIPAESSEQHLLPVPEDEDSPIDHEPSSPDDDRAEEDDDSSLEGEDNRTASFDGDLDDEAPEDEQMAYSSTRNESEEEGSDVVAEDSPDDERPENESPTEELLEMESAPSVSDEDEAVTK